MGQCFVKEFKSLVVPTRSSIDNLSDLRQLAVSLIIKLNSILIACKISYQDSLLNRNRNISISLKIKEDYIKQNISTLQRLVKKLDDPDKKKFSNHILKGTFIPIKSIENLILSGHFDNLSDYPSLNININEIESEVTTDLESINKTQGFIRRKYFKNQLHN